MKKVFLITVLAVLAGDLFGQGSVNFANTSATKVFLDDGTPVPIGSTFLVELMFAPDGTPSDAFDSVAVRLGAPATFRGAGIFSDGTRTAIQITPPGAFGLFQVRVWEAAAGASYRDAVATANAQWRAGQSAVLRVDTADPTLIGVPQTPASLPANGLTSFTLTPIPEPSLSLLGLLGAAALWCRWQRSKQSGV